MKIVTLREPDTGRVFDREATRVAMELPSAWPDDAAVIVTVDDLEWIRPGMDSVTHRSTTRRLEQFFSGERCLVPSKRISPEGRTLWRVVHIVASVHLANPPEGD